MLEVPMVYDGIFGKINFFIVRYNYKKIIKLDHWYNDRTLTVDSYSVFQKYVTEKYMCFILTLYNYRLKNHSISVNKI